MPPANICIPDETSGLRGSGARRATSDPVAQAEPETSRATAPSASIRLGPGRPREQRHATEAHEQPQQRHPRQALAVRNAVEERHPERDGGDQQRRDARVDARLRPGDERVAADEQQRSDDDGRRSHCRRPGRRRSTSPRRHGPDVEQAAGDHEPDPHRQEDRDRVDREQDSEVRRSPDDVHDGEGRPDPCRADASGSVPSSVVRPPTPPVAIVEIARTGQEWSECGTARRRRGRPTTPMFMDADFRGALIISTSRVIVELDHAD